MKEKLPEETPQGGGASKPIWKMTKHKELFWIVPTVVLLAIVLALIFG